MLLAAEHIRFRYIQALWTFLWIFAGASLAHAQEGAANPQPPSRDLPTLTTVREVISLDMGLARREPHPARIRGVVTMVARGWPNWIYVQDSTGGGLVVYRSVTGELVEGAEVEAEQDTLRALDAERELGELKSRFVSLVSHEFRTPLGITMSASNVDHVSGTGLGLLIVRRCVDLHQGRIDFESRLGEGTTFRVRIPAYSNTPG